MLLAGRSAITPPNTLGLRQIMFAVEDIDGAELVGEVVQYEDKYRLCYMGFAHKVATRGKFPSLEKEGWTRHLEDFAKPPLMERTGWFVQLPINR
jgi:hypothetical protein